MALPNWAHFCLYTEAKMSEKEHKEVILRIYEEVFNQGNIDLIDELYQPDVIIHDPYLPGETARGTALIKDLCQAYSQAFPDLHYQVGELIADGEKIASQWHATGTHQGMLQLGADQFLQPSGEKVSVYGISLARFVEGSIAEVWQVVDMLGAFRQMKAVELKTSGGNLGSV